ncbi:MAG: hypothetical protein IJU44_12885, partial [Kiritimatiellae bacterium]|nr:hypothetical protein [Kiritimatiellia bacterium]
RGFDSLHPLHSLDCVFPFLRFACRPSGFPMFFLFPHSDSALAKPFPVGYNYGSFFNGKERLHK